MKVKVPISCETSSKSEEADLQNTMELQQESNTKSHFTQPFQCGLQPASGKTQ